MRWPCPPEGGAAVVQLGVVGHRHRGYVVVDAAIGPLDDDLGGSSGG